MTRIQRQRRIKAAAKYLSDYMRTYEFVDASDATFMNDVLYGLGIALHGDKFKYANGFDAWKAELREFLKEQAA